MKTVPFGVEHRDTIVLIVTRAEVEGTIEARTETFLSALTSTPESIREHFSRVVILFEGYDAESKELWMIPEVSTFVRGIDAVFPYWGFFLSASTIPMIARCILGPEVHASLPAPYINKLLGVVLEKAFVSIGAMAGRAGFSQIQFDRRVSEITRAVLGVSLNL